MRKIQWNENRIVYFPVYTEEDGLLCPIEFDTLPFIPKRIFYVKNVPIGQERGHHAHYATEQVLICIQGKILVTLFDGKECNEYTLKPHQAIYIPKMVWDKQRFLSGTDIMLSIASTSYNYDDYITDFNKFKELTL